MFSFCLLKLYLFYKVWSGLRFWKECLVTRTLFVSLHTCHNAGLVRESFTALSVSRAFRLILQDSELLSHCPFLTKTCSKHCKTVPLEQTLSPLRVFPLSLSNMRLHPSPSHLSSKLKEVLNGLFWEQTLSCMLNNL